MEWSGIQRYGMILIVIIVGMSLFAALYPEASEAGDSIGDEGMCENNACFYNASRTLACTANNETPADTTACAAAGYATGGFPLAGLAASGGVLFIVIAASILWVYLKKAR